MKTMKSLLKLVLLMSLCGIMLLAAACGEEPAAETPNVPDEPVAPETPAVNPHDAPEGTFIGVLDMTDSYTLVPAITGADAEDRRGKSCEEGFVQVAAYSTDGLTREKFYQLSWEELALDGAPWEFLGATFELDVTGEAPKLKNTPEKTAFSGSYADLSFDSFDKVIFKEKTYEITSLDFGYMRDDDLIEEGGWYLPSWDNKAMADSNARVWRNKDGNYLFLSVPLYNKTLVVTTNAKFNTTYGLTSVAIIGDRILGLNNMDKFLGEMLGWDNYAVQTEAYATDPSSITNRIEPYELFKFDDAFNCLGWQNLSERVQRFLGVIEADAPEYIVVNAGRRDTMYIEKNITKTANAIKWLSENYPKATILVVVDQPYPTATFGTMAFNTVIQTAEDHYKAIYDFAKSATDGLENVKLVNVGGAFLKGMQDGMKLYGTEGNYITHPNVEGTYIVSCMLYSAITDEKAADALVPDAVNAELAPEIKKLADSFSFESGPIL